MALGFDIDFSQVQRGIVKLPRFGDFAVEPIKAAIDEVSTLILADVHRTISGTTGTGRVYRRGRRRFRASPGVTGGTAAAFHRASSPGQPPVSDSGHLLRSLKRAIAKSNKKQIRGAVRAPAFYGFMLESGTLRIRPRPFMVEAGQRHKGEFDQKIGDAIDVAGRKTNDQIGGAA